MTKLMKVHAAIIRQCPQEVQMPFERILIALSDLREQKKTRKTSELKKATLEELLAAYEELYA